MTQYLICTDCGESKPTSQFYMGYTGPEGNRRQYRIPVCKRCTRAKQQARRTRDDRMAGFDPVVQEFCLRKV